MFVKVCGITREEDAQAALELGASAIGFIFWPGSPRHVTPEQAGAIVSELPPTVTAVGVFVDEPVDGICEIAARSGITADGVAPQPANDSRSIAKRHEFCTSHRKALGV